MTDEKLPSLSGELAAGIRQALGNIPQDLLGIAVGDWLEEKRKINRERLEENTKKILKERGIQSDQQVASPKLFIAICEAAMDEDRDALQNLWARLLAAAVDKSRADLVRTNYIDIVKQLDPIDALVLSELSGSQPNTNRNLRNEIAGELGLPPDQIEVSLLNLHRLGLVAPVFDLKIESGQVYLATLGRELLRALN